MNVYKIAGRLANCVDPNQTPRYAASDLGLHCLLILTLPNTQSKYYNLIKWNPHRNHPRSEPERFCHCRPWTDTMRRLLYVSLQKYIYLRAYTKCTDSNHPAHIPIISRAFRLHSYIL